MISDLQEPEVKLSKNEYIKVNSNYLRGTILEGLADPITGAISEDDTQLTKFHGTYMQDDRDVRSERRMKKLESAYSFMIRVRVAGGVCTPAQYLEMDRLADDYANGTLKLTTRQAFQFHGVLKRNLKTTMKEINDTLLDTIAACGDVNRNVMLTATPPQSAFHEAVLESAKAINDHLTPKTRAYHEIWLDEEKVITTEDEVVEPIYGKTYLPRKFKIGIAIPPYNDVDVYSQDLGFIAIEENGELVGYNVLVGGGFGTTHGDKNTFPRLGDLIGFCSADQVVNVAEKVVLVQRDHGDRTNRKHARLKYTIEDHGVEWFKTEVENRLGYKLEAARPFKFSGNGDRYGWTQGTNGKWNLTLFVEGGRVRDTEALKMKTCLREVAKVHTGDFRLTGNQNLVIGNVEETEKGKIEAILKEFNFDQSYITSGMRLSSIACVALPTCGLSMAESERYLPTLVTKLEKILEEVGLFKEEIVIRMTGCPNGCGRPYLGEIAFIGKAPGKYNMYLGAGFVGDRLNKLYKENIGEEEILESLDPIIRDFAKSREEGEKFGDFVIRKGYIKETTAGNNFHD